ncbi:hypothetical protein QR680_009755 [Steinernema hermaphroditum]|uniref:G-protein coupled receptors family 1 profile domain-containing protein n=1 Tax=Steinernema hermaphroditum TaxID=289476 RepID=A0AA39ILJ3_9BILA|nr:hypothetical protein QR680_009755 [Steinernema hermaphroditum]
MNCTGVPAPNTAFTDATLYMVICYSACFAIAFVGNTTMFLILFRNQLVKRRRVHTLLLHMNIAHLLVTLIYMPKEVIHAITVAWLGGDLLCRICKFFDVFGVALSANILICISLDRFYSIFFPLYTVKARKTVQRMIFGAWLLSFISSVPQLYMFREARHPCHPWYTQCVSADIVGVVSSKVTFSFSILNIIQVYFLPLVVIIICYSLILKKISSAATGPKGECKGKTELRRSGNENLERAKSRTLKMSFVIVILFLLCWTPYTIALFIHFLRRSLHVRPVPPLLSKFLYAFAVFNSAISPYLYGYFSFDLKSELSQLLTKPFFQAHHDRLTLTTATITTTRKMAMRKRSLSNGTVSTDDQRRLIRERLSNGSLIVSGNAQGQRRASKQASLHSCKSLDHDRLLIGRQAISTNIAPVSSKSRQSIMSSYKPSLTILDEAEKNAN